MKRPLSVVLVTGLCVALGVMAWRGERAEHAVEVEVPWSGALPVLAPPPGPLSGLTVYLSAGHGWLLHRDHHDGLPVQWSLQREASFGLTEDLWTAAFVADELAPALEDAGATVIALRERDRNPEQVSSWGGGPGFAAAGVATRGPNTVLKPNGQARWTLPVPHDGRWMVYGRWRADEDHDANATFTVIAGDEVRRVSVDQRHHGGHWFSLADLCLRDVEWVEVWLEGSGGGSLSAEAVRLGGGTYSSISPVDQALIDEPFFEVSVQQQLEHLGGPEALRRYACGAPVSDMRVRGRWVSWAHPPGEEAVFLSIHTNASEGTARGLMVFAGVDGDPPTPPLPDSVEIAQQLERHIMRRVRARDPAFRSHGVSKGDYSEISPLQNDVPGALIELGFHDDRWDARRLRDPVFRRAAVEGILEGLVAWRGAGR